MLPYPNVGLAINQVKSNPWSDDFDLGSVHAKDAIFLSAIGADKILEVEKDCEVLDRTLVSLLERGLYDRGKEDMVPNEFEERAMRFSAACGVRLLGHIVEQRHEVCRSCVCHFWLLLRRP